VKDDGDRHPVVTQIYVSDALVLQSHMNAPQSISGYMSSPGKYTSI